MYVCLYEIVIFRHYVTLMVIVAFRKTSRKHNNKENVEMFFDVSILLLSASKFSVIVQHFTHLLVLVFSKTCIGMHI